VTEALEDILCRCRERGVAVGTFVEDVATTRHWHAKGLAYLSYSVDVGIFLDACREIVAAVKGDADA